LYSIAISTQEDSWLLSRIVDKQGADAFDENVLFGSHAMYSLQFCSGGPMSIGAKPPMNF
jgi:hypothetical protein